MRRIPLTVAILLVALRIVVGWHFYKEGVDKLRDKRFTSAGFLASAKGPAAPYYHSLVRDIDGVGRLNLDTSEDYPRIDVKITLAAWENHRQAVSEHYQFGDASLIAELEAKQKQREEAGAHKAARDLRRRVQHVQKQPEKSKEILKGREQQLRWFFKVYEPDIEEYFQGLERRRSNAGDASKVEVASLRAQSESIETELRQKRAPWLVQLDELWDGYDRELQSLSTPEQQARGYYRMQKADEKWLDVETIDRFLPYFDMIVGGLLVIGLLARWAALAGAVFLGSVIASQWPTAPGAAPTYYQSVELMALLVVAVAGAGRFAGLDFFFDSYRKWRRAVKLQTEENDE